MQLNAIAFDHARVALETSTWHLHPFGIAHGGVSAIRKESRGNGRTLFLHEKPPEGRKRLDY